MARPLAIDSTELGGVIRDDGLPKGTVGMPSGHRVDVWRDLAADWSAEDAEAMETYLEGRMRAQFEPLVDKAAEARNILLRQRSTAGQLAHMWRLGLHPLRTEADPLDDEGSEPRFHSPEAASGARISDFLERMEAAERDPEQQRANRAFVEALRNDADGRLHRALGLEWPGGPDVGTARE